VSYPSCNPFFAPYSSVCRQGTGVLVDDAKGERPSDRIYYDTKADDIDTLDPEAPHRPIDLVIRSATNELEGKAKITIILPPLIYGLGSGPFNRLSIQVPTLIRSAVKRGFAPVVGQGKNLWYVSLLSPNWVSR
jgi:hypothetical protein